MPLLISFFQCIPSDFSFIFSQESHRCNRQRHQVRNRKMTQTLFPSSNQPPTLVSRAYSRRRWLTGDFMPTVQKRGAAIIAARGASSAASAGAACIDHIRDWHAVSRWEIGGSCLCRCSFLARFVINMISLLGSQAASYAVVRVPTALGRPWQFTLTALSTRPLFSRPFSQNTSRRNAFLSDERTGTESPRASIFHSL